MSKNERKPLRSLSDEMSDEELTLHAADPEKEAEDLRETRNRHKRKYGTSDHVLDKLYGLRSRPK